MSSTPINPSTLQRQILARLIVAMLLGYALLVQGFAGHQAPLAGATDAIAHLLCITGDDGSQSTSIDDANGSIPSPVSHHADATCCIVSGLGHLPEFSGIPTLFIFAERQEVILAFEFQHRVHDPDIHELALPRAPPIWG